MTSLSAQELALRAAVLGELGLVQDRIALVTKLGGTEAKEQIRYAHAAQRRARLEEAAEFLAEREDALIGEFADGDEVDPAAIDPVVIPVRTQAEAELFRFATLQWSVPVSSGYGRRSRFLVRDRYNGKLMAIFAMGDPVIAQSARDLAIGWGTRQRNARLYNVYDAFILGAVDPYRQLLAGKLAALLTLANETREFLARKYAGRVAMRGEAKDPTPALITTSSALGRSSVYNRVTYRGHLMFHSVGYTKGFGHFQFSDELFDALLAFARDRDGTETKALSNQYKSGPNWRFRVLRNALEALDIPEEHLQHNIRREVFLAPTAANWDAYLRGEAQELMPFDLPTESIAEYYRERWAVGRASRRPGYRHWRRAEARLTPLLEVSTERALLETRPAAGRVDLGDYHLSIGTAVRPISGETASGHRSEGTAYLSRFEGPGVDLTIADITWATGEREVRGLDCRDGDFGDLVGRLRIGVHAASRFRGMSCIELRAATRATGPRATARKTTVESFDAMLALDLREALDSICEASVGTRAELLADTGVRKAQLCTVFQSDDVVAPALGWCLTRILPVLRESDPGARLGRPQLRRAAPRPADLR